MNVLDHFWRHLYVVKFGLNSNKGSEGIYCIFNQKKKKKQLKTISLSSALKLQLKYFAVVHTAYVRNSLLLVLPP
jgi:hypothetical protein